MFAENNEAILHWLRADGHTSIIVDEVYNEVDLLFYKKDKENDSHRSQKLHAKQAETM